MKKWITLSILMLSISAQASDSLFHSWATCTGEDPKTSRRIDFELFHNVAEIMTNGQLALLVTRKVEDLTLASPPSAFQSLVSSKGILIYSYDKTMTFNYGKGDEIKGEYVINPGVKESERTVELTCQYKGSSSIPALYQMFLDQTK